MSYYVGLPLIFLAALVEASVLPLFQLGGLQPNLVLVILVAWLMVRGANEAFVLIPAGGLFLGLTESAPLGTALVALAPIAILHELRGAHLRESGLVMTTAFALLMTIVYHLVYLLAFSISGHGGDWLVALPRIVLPACLINAIVLVPVYAALTAASQGLRRPGYA